MESGTKRTHFNPAFWIANWSPEYPPIGQTSARDCRVFVLYVRSRSIASVRVENVHFEKGLGRAILPVDFAKQIIDLEGVSEEERSEIIAEIDSAGDLIIDCESMFSAIEASSSYRYLAETIATQRIETWDQKANLSAFIAIQHLRHPRQWNRMLRWREDVMGKPRWESLVRMMLPSTWREIIGSFANELSQSRWVLHVSREDAFPIADCAVAIDRDGNRVWAPLSPKLLLEIITDQRTPPPEVATTLNLDETRPSPSDYLRCITMQADSMILFSEPTLLGILADSEPFRLRSKA